MGALDKARDLATKAAGALADAEANAEAEQTARDERNTERRRTYWESTGLPVARTQHQRVADAQRDFREAVATGDGAATLTAYLDYSRTHAEANAFLNAARNATGKLRADNSGMIDYPVQGLNGQPDDFPVMLDRAVKALAGEQGQSYSTGYLQPLRDSLEREDG